MNKNKLILILIFAVMAVSSLPILAFTIKLNLAKKSLHIDKKRYEIVNMVCFEEKNPSLCAELLKEDLNVLLGAHKKNTEFLRSQRSFVHPLKLAKAMYKEQENISAIEPEILLKTLIIKKILFKDLSNPVASGMLSSDIETYIEKNFSDANKPVALRAFDSQNEDFEKYTKKMNCRKKSKRPAEKEKSAEPFETDEF